MNLKGALATFGSRQRAQRTLAWGGALFIAAVVALEGYNVVRSYRTTVANTGRELDSQARILAEQTARSVQAVDVVLRYIAAQLQKGALAGTSERERYAYLQEQAVGLVQINGLHLGDAAGRTLASWVYPTPASVADVSDRAFYKVPRDVPSVGLYVGGAIQSRIDGEWLFPMARRIERPDGTFNGIVAARGRVAYFAQFYRDVQLDPGTKITLMHQDGTLLSRYPQMETALGKRFPLFDEMLASHESGQPGPSRTVSPIDGVERFGAIALVPEYPLAVLVTRDVSAALAPWREQAWRAVAHVLALSALAALLLAIAMRQLSRLHKARESLTRSEERFALAVAGSNDGIIDWDIASGRFYSSKRAMEIVGIDSDVTERSRDEWVSLVRYQDRARAREDLLRFLASRDELRDVEYQIALADGSLRWVRHRHICVRDVSGRALRLTGSISDVTAQKRAEEALRESEQRFTLAVAGSNDGIWDFDFGTERVFVSARARQLSGMGPGPEAISLEEWSASLALRIHPDDLPRRTTALEAHMAGETPHYEVEIRHRHPDGVYRWARVRGLCTRHAAGKPLRMAGSISDIDAQKRAEEALRESEQRFALAVAGANDGIVDWDIVNDRLFISQRAMRILGIHSDTEIHPHAEWIAMAHVHEDDKARFDECFRWIVEGQSDVREEEFRFGHPEGFRWVRIRGAHVRDASGRAMRWAGSVSDIDAHKRAEEALRQSQERFALAVDGSNDGIVDWDIVNDRMFSSKRAMEIVGVQSDETVRTRAEWRDLVVYHKDDVKRMKEDLESFLAGRTEMRDGVYRVLRPDGSYRWIRHRNKCVRDAEGRPIRVAGSVSDIDAQVRAEAALRESEARYQLAVDGSNQGLWDWHLLSDQLFLSPRAQELMGVEPSKSLRPRREWISLSPYHPDDREAVRAAISAHLHGETGHFTAEYRLRHPSGEWRWIRQRGLALRDDRGRAYRMAGSMEDVTDYKNAEADRARLEDQLLQAKKLEAIGTLAGGIAHDFNNILSAILGYGEMAQKDAREGTPLRRHIDAAMSAGHRAKSLVERILAFSRSGMGERVPVHVQSVVGEALDLVAASLPKGVKLERELQAGDAAVLGDPTQIHQVVMNLCTNAIQAMKSGGQLTVSLDLVEKSGARLATSVLSGGKYLRLGVRDTGAGIPPSVLERIFDPFFTTKEVGVGTGLGLSLVHGIVTDLGGGIDVESRVGEGATFTVYLPWSSSAAAPANVDEAVPEGSGQTILLVDDEEPLVRLGEEMIAGLGYEPVGFTSSAAALQSFRASPGRFHAVLSDEAMPEMTGSDLAKEIHAIRPDIPIVLMSGFVSPALLGRARDLGVMEVLAKPLVERDIARGLASALRNGGRT
jgi:PAS domain S-box-containing protein